MRWEQVPDLPLFANGTAAFIHDMDASAISNVAGDSNYVRVQVLTPVGVLDRDRQLGVVKELTEIVVAAAGDPSLAQRIWVLLTESPEGGWGAGHANTNADIAALARAALQGQERHRSDRRDLRVRRLTVGVFGVRSPCRVRRPCLSAGLRRGGSGHLARRGAGAPAASTSQARSSRASGAPGSTRSESSSTGNSRSSWTSRSLPRCRVAERCATRSGSQAGFRRARDDRRREPRSFGAGVLRRCRGPELRGDGLDDQIGRLQLRHMTRSFQHLKSGTTDRLGIRAAVLDVDDPVAPSPENTCRDREGSESFRERGIGHRGGICRKRTLVGDERSLLFCGERRWIPQKRRRVVERELHDLRDRQAGDVCDRMAGNVDSDGVDQDQPTESARLEEGELGGDPPPDRVSDDGDILEDEPLEEGGIETGEVRDACELLGPVGQREPRMGRRERARRNALGQASGKDPHRGGPGAPVEQEERSARACLLDSERGCLTVACRQGVRALKHGSRDRCTT